MSEIKSGTNSAMLGLDRESLRDAAQRGALGRFGAKIMTGLLVDRVARNRRSEP
jgi:hypothetical protein